MKLKFVVQVCKLFLIHRDWKKKYGDYFMQVGHDITLATRLLLLCNFFGCGGLSPHPLWPGQGQGFLRQLVRLKTTCYPISNQSCIPLDESE